MYAGEDGDSVQMSLGLNGDIAGNNKDKKVKSKNKLRREKKKAAKAASKEQAGNEAPQQNGAGRASSAGDNTSTVKDVQIEYVSADLESEISDPALEEFKEIFKKFASAEELCGTKSEATTDAADQEKRKEEPAQQEQRKEDGEDADDEGEGKLSRRQRKKLHRLSVAELKQVVMRPDVVEAHDITSSDPRLLVHVKAYRNTVPVPRHWCHKRKYLQGKRGLEKLPFQLPEFIEATGIRQQREAIEEKMKMQTVKQRMRERVNPKLGRMDVDYARLEDAFLRYQTKPKLTQHGDLYYEGKEFEVKMKDKKPGILSGDLQAALGMQPGYPPPWLMNMQRYGPPPSYPNLRIPGLNAPIPEGCSFGMHPGGWGKPPVDEYGRPVYGDVFGTMGDQPMGQEEVNRTHWGELEFEEEEEEAEEEEELEEGEEPERDVDGTGLETPLTDATGLSSVISGLETPENIELRKRAGLETPESVGGPKELYKVLEQREVAGAQAGLFGSDKRYVLDSNRDVQIALNPDEIVDQLRDEDALKERYENELEARQTARRADDDDEDDDQGQRKRKRDKATDEKAKKSKGKDTFKF